MSDGFSGSSEELLRHVPPHSVEAERAVLGAVLMDPTAMDEIAGDLQPDHFYRTAHAAIYQAMIDLWRQDQPVDVVLLNEELARRDQLDAVGGTPALVELTVTVPTAANAVFYAEVVRDHHTRRQLITVAAEVQKDAFESRDLTEHLLDRSEKRLFDVTQKRIRSEAVPVGTAVEEAFQRLQMIQSGQGVTGLHSGYADLDELTQGFQPGEMSILAARPSMGKCVAADALVVLGDGTLATMEAVVQRRAGEVVTLRGDWRFGTEAPSAYVDDGLKPVYRVVTKLGREVQTTWSHPFLREDGWTKLGELSIGDKVAVPGRLPVFGERGRPTRELALVAYLLACGTAQGEGFEVAMRDPLLASDLCEAAADFAERRRTQLEAVSCGEGRWRLEGGQVFRAWAKGRGLVATEEGEAAFPEDVFQLPREGLAEVLRRFVAASATVEQAGEDVRALTLTLRGELLARQVQHLLLRFGVVGARSLSDAGVWTLRVARHEALLALRDEVGVFGLSLARVEGERALVGHAAGAGAGRAVGRSGWGERSLNRQDVNALAGAWEDRGLSEVAGSDVVWDEIVSITPLGERQVYDLTVPETHNFVADDVCVHNTSFALNILRNLTVYHGRSAAFFSLEMPRLQVTSNMLCSIARIDGNRLRGGYLTKEEERQFLDAAEVLSPAQLYIDDTPGLSTMDLRAKARRLKSKYGIDMIMIDYLQLMRGTPGQNTESRQQEVSEISRLIKQLARELEIPILALAQLSRKVEERKDHKPMLSDLRESGSIEQDADTVSLLYRPDYYHDTEDDDDQPQPAQNAPGAPVRAFVNVAKNRNGPTGELQLTFYKSHMRFESCA